MSFWFGDFELYALNPPDVQARFASLLGRLAEEGEVHVLLSLRDDFLFRCGESERLRPVFQDLTPLYPLSPDALRHALVEPARRKGYRFEEDALVEEMMEAVASERGALPPLAFAVSRLWEERDRSRKLLTREAYERIEGVAGALAQHAEETLSQLGPEREGMVREIFRDLVTAQGTRAAADRAELLSVFGERREEAGAVLDALVDARLLTEYEPADTEPPPVAHRRIEIVHESLLTHWPRLVRWRTQDADGAQLRDQLRQTAHLWDERGRPEDLLWSGTSYLDYGAWRARYSGGLSAIEEAFAQAMTALANRRRRRRRAVLAATVAALTVGLGVVGLLWSRSETARRRADTGALEAEAGRLLALGEAALEQYPTAALAYVTRSLELADTEEGRLLALRVLQDAPTAFAVPGGEPAPDQASFSPDGRWLLAGGVRNAHLRPRDGGEPVVLPDSSTTGFVGHSYAWGPGNLLVVTGHQGYVGVWSVPEGREVRRFRIEPGSQKIFARTLGFYASTTTRDRELVTWTPFGGDAPRLVGSADPADLMDVDPAGSRMAYAPGGPFSGRKLYVRSLEDWAAPPRMVADVHPEIVDIAFSHDGRDVATADKSGRIQVWAADGRSNRPRRVIDCPGVLDIAFSPRGRWLAAVAAGQAMQASLWDLTAPPAAEPLRFPLVGIAVNKWAFDPTDRWLATAPGLFGIDLWPLGESYPRSVGRHDWFVDNVAFTPDGSALVSLAGGADGTVRTRSLALDARGEERILLRADMNFAGLAVDRGGTRAAVSTVDGAVAVVPLAGGTPRRLEGFSSGTGGALKVAFSPNGRQLAAAARAGTAEDKVLRLWDLDRGTGRVSLSLPGAGEGRAGGVSDLAFLDGEHVLTASPTSGVLLFDLRTGRHTVLSSRHARAVAVDARKDALFAVLRDPDELVRITLDGREPTKVFSCRHCLSVDVDPGATIVAAGSEEGILRVGPTSGGEPHLFFSKVQGAHRVAVSPDGRWVATTGERSRVRLWPVPDVTRTPLHRRRHDELLATLHSWTNLRAVKDPQSPTGWKLEPGPFPGWTKLPEW